MTLSLIFLFMFLPTFAQSLSGHHQAKLITLNPHINGTIPGSVNFYFLGTQVYAHVRIFAGRTRAWHMQNVYEGGRCPILNDDRNFDGHIDILEAELVMGKKLIPLDGNINTQKAGIEFFPVGDEMGSYIYEEFASYTTFMKDLKARDPNRKDDLRKLKVNEELKLVSRTVLIQGVTLDVNFPETVATKGIYPIHQSLPIACGVFVKIKP